ncbi:class I SAM-dependent methyltransferase [Tabrizicola sp.]|uniref:class I SAM-dependent methyltransferase n=1 Tax=Tabrizicola sp. TaxID=2005166 RepID=UPI0035ADE0AB
MAGLDISPTHSNRDLRDEIKDYWSDRAATFDLDPGHKIAAGAERAAWKVLFRRHLGEAGGRRLLDLASGTGEIAMLCHELGYRVTGLDWAEPMLDRARAKAAAAGADVIFLQADAERTMLPAASQDVIVTRHLVWTLVDPAAAFAEWFRVLAPGGQLLVVDGDFVSKSRAHRLLSRLLGLTRRPVEGGMADRHAGILSRVHFSTGARAVEVAFLLEQAGFTEIVIDTRLGQIHKAQLSGLGWKRVLLRSSEHRYAISARKE